MSRIGFLKRSISTAVAALVLVDLLSPANAAYQNDTEDHLAGLRDQEGGGAKVSSKSSNHFWPRGGEDDVQRN